MINLMFDTLSHTAVAELHVLLWSDVSTPVVLDVPSLGVLLATSCMFAVSSGFAVCRMPR